MCGEANAQEIDLEIISAVKLFLGFGRLYMRKFMG
jgi:hypothetical protein